MQAEYRDAVVKDLDKMRSKILLHRWGSLYAFLQQLLQCKDIICQCWNLDAMLRRASAKDEDDELESLNTDGSADVEQEDTSKLISSVHKVVVSPMFWAMASMISYLLASLEHLSDYS